MMNWVHPSAIFFLAALACPLVRGKGRAPFLAGSALAALAALWFLAPQSSSYPVLGLWLTPFKADALARVFALVFCIVAFLGVVYGLHVEKPGEHAAGLVLAGSAVGVTLAGDWITLFVFWELMSVSSLFVIWQGSGVFSRGAGFRYLFVHALGGGLMFAGILLHLSGGGGMELGPLLSGGREPGAAFWLILTAVAINAAIPPLHSWLTDSYPECSPAGSVLQSAFTTKAAVYVLLRVFPGTEVLVPLGVAMALYGVVFAVLENDIRRLLAYHIVSQVGYMVAGAGMGTVLASNGSAAHAFCHVLYKALLFMGAGAVVHAAGKGKLTELGGLAREMPAVFWLYMIGAFSISGAPLLNGFVSKSMVVEAAHESGRPLAELLLHLASIGTFLHTGLKLPYFTFFGSKGSGLIRPVPFNMILAMGLASLLCAATGIFPGWLYSRLPGPVDYHPYTFHHVFSALQLLAGTAAGFWLLRSKLGGEPTVTLDADWLYRRPLARLLELLTDSAGRIGRLVRENGEEGLRKAFDAAARPGSAPGSSPIGLILFWTAALFALGVLFSG